MLRHSDNVHVVTRVEKNLYKVTFIVAICQTLIYFEMQIWTFFYNYSETTTDCWYFL